MTKGKQALIGALVTVTGLSAIFGVNKYQNKRDMEALPETMVQEAAPVYEVAGSPDAAGAVYEVSNGIMPGMYTGDEYLAKDKLLHNPDGTVTYDGENYKRNTYMHATLLLGIDDTNAADGIFLLCQDTSRNVIKVLMIPRDSMLEMRMTDAEGNPFWHFDHISLSHDNGTTREEMAGYSVQAVSDLLCGLSINHYMVTGLEAFTEVNDMVGGVIVTVPTDELVKVHPEWTKGKEITLVGEDAERFIRYRDIQEDGTPVIRMEQHRAYIKGFYQKIQKDKSLITKLSDYVENKTTSDLSKGEYEKLALDALTCSFDTENDILKLPGDAVMGLEDGVVYDQYYINYEETIPLLLDLFYRKVE